MDRAERRCTRSAIVHRGSPQIGNQSVGPADNSCSTMTTWGKPRRRRDCVVRARPRPQRMTMATQPATKYSRIALELNAPIARLTLSNPPLNIIDISMMEELFEALTEINARSDISVLIV